MNHPQVDEKKDSGPSLSAQTQNVHCVPFDPTTGAISPPLVLSTTFQYQASSSGPQIHNDSNNDGFIYSREDNPNRLALERTMAKMEHGSCAYAVPSGSSALMNLFQALRPGDHIVASDDMYYGVKVQLVEFLPPWGVETTFVDIRDLDAVKKAMKVETRIVLLESPTNPMIRLADIRAIADLVHQHNNSIVDKKEAQGQEKEETKETMLIVDNTAATPIGQNPLDLGAHIVVHALTKYIAGHSDVLGGVIIFKETNQFSLRVGRLVKVGGAVLSPMMCWLTLRGIPTLHCRMKTHSENALAVANYLSEHPKVERVLYPHHPSHPQYELALKQTKMGSGLMSILVKGGREEALALQRSLKLFSSATSFGGTHSTIEQRETVEKNTYTPPNLLRVSVGLEHPNDLIADLERALSQL